MEPIAQAPSLDIRLLGPFRVLVDGREVPEEAWQRRRAKTLVKLLALEPEHQIHREILMELMWPDAPPESAANSLNKVVHAARRALEPDLDRAGQSAFLLTRDQHLLLRAPGGLHVDAIEFERRANDALRGDDEAAFESVLTLYEDDLLVEDRYDDWLETRRLRLRLLRRDILRRLAASVEARGDRDATIRLLEEIVESDPLDEEANRRLIDGLARRGLRGRALEQFRRFKELLRSEVGADPEPATRELRDQVAAGTIGPDPATDAGPVASAAETTQRPRGLGFWRGTRFFGRASDLEGLELALGRNRLVTLQGPGGIGKTRLAVRLAQDLAGEFAGGVWVVELGGIAEPALVDRALASVLGVAEQPGSRLLDAIAAALPDEGALLVLDNCEHLVEACATVTTELLGSSRHLRVIATSREPLGVEGEIVWRVPPMTLPPADGATRAAHLETFEASRLFVDRARLRTPGFDPSDAEAATIARICRRLDGIPLAIELSAACVGALSLDAIAERLEDRIDLPPAPTRATPPRHRSLRAVLDWSFELLTQPERALLARLSVFAGGFSLDAAEAVCAVPPAEPEVFLGLVTRLVDVSLLEADFSGASARYRMLDTVRIYAAEKLRETEEVDRISRAHAEWAARYAESVEAALTGQDQRRAVARLDAERDNLWAALRWSFAHLGEDGGLALRLMAALWLWFQRSNLEQGRVWLEAVLADEGPQPEPLRARALHGLGNFARLQGDYRRATALLEESVALWRRIGDRAGLVRAIHTLASVVSEVGDYDGGAMLHREAAEICRQLGDPIGIAKSLYALGVQAVYFGEFERAEERFEEALDLFRRVGAEGSAMVTLHNLAEVALLTGDGERAERLVTSSLEVSRRIGETLIAPRSTRLLGDILAAAGRWEQALAHYREAADVHLAQGDRPGLVETLESLSRLASSTGDGASALTLLGAATALREQIRLPAHPYERSRLDETDREARALVTDEIAQRACELGRELQVEAVLLVGFLTELPPQDAS